MVAPGLAGLETVMRLHDAARIGHPKATWGVTEGNPVHDDVREIARMTGVHFALDVTLNRNQEITAAFAGDIFEEHAAACAHATKNAMRPVEAPFDVVVTTNSGYPLDQNLYQAVKGMSAASTIVKPGGTIVLRSGMSRWHSEPWRVWQDPGVGQLTATVAGYDHDTRLFAPGSMAGPNPGADST